MTALPDDATPGNGDRFRQRLLDGLAAAITERGYRASTVADIVRHARTSKRTFYDRFASKEACFIELLRANNSVLRADIRRGVDPDADWRDQIHQAVQVYVDHITAHPALTLSWIRELPALAAAGRPLQREGMAVLTDLLMELSSGPGFRRAGVAPLTPELAVILLGGLRELTALAVEDGRDAREILAPALDASIALLSPRALG